jgi:hypothetical protein
LASKRVIAYIDGFNLYFGLKSMGWEKYFWLNVRGMVESLLLPDQELAATKYFTSRVNNNPGKQKRQGDYLEALQTAGDVQIFYGKYQMNQRSCRNCGIIDNVPNEKMTDVNIAVELLADAFTDAFDIAILISADSDLVAPIKKVKSILPLKRIVVFFPPKRFSFDLKNAAGFAMQIGRAVFAKNQFPNTVLKPDGYKLIRPANWN